MNFRLNLKLLSTCVLGEYFNRSLSFASVFTKMKALMEAYDGT